MLSAGTLPADALATTGVPSRPFSSTQVPPREVPPGTVRSSYGEPGRIAKAQNARVAATAPWCMFVSAVTDTLEAREHAGQVEIAERESGRSPQRARHPAVAGCGRC